jgi:hypothetical protein
MKKTYPELKKFCQGLGYEFQVVDMRWGIREQSNDEHTATQLCLKELKLCKELSTGPFFVVSIMTDWYGVSGTANMVRFEIVTLPLVAIMFHQPIEVLE